MALQLESVIFAAADKCEQKVYVCRGFGQNIFVDLANRDHVRALLPSYPETYDTKLLLGVKLSALAVGAAVLRGQRSREQPLRLLPRRLRPNPLSSASLLSKLLVLWFQPLVSLGARCPLSAADLWPVCASDSCRVK
ncbi:hypothetical protein PHYPSEUDO_001069 [Phytophthora pseudosyringae]|uniref:Uncharacterized protein n=1 Tax=Phytophthora pseudosyringae TaxID=221518 RepID=A0A8T1W1I1_9STRA|nr:hypothetical protein PHYPSEUDO_001069 [Phytophthora pseudosyringae]